MKSFEYKSVPQRKKEDPSKGKPGITRRQFLGGVAALFGTGIMARTVEEIYEKGKNEFVDSGSEIIDSKDSKPIIGESEPETPAFEQDEILKTDIESIESIADILDFDKKGPIRLTPEKMENVKNYWKEKYGNKKNNLHKDLTDGYRDWGYWRPYTEEKFRSVGVPLEYALLALPESSWRVNARSKAGAVGPYQFMPKTAASLKLKINRVVDERRDPVKSAEACALVLKELYKVSGDWNVALSGYNGGTAWKFIKEARSKGQITNYENFLKFLEEKLNKEKDNLQTNNKYSNLSHEARRKIFAQNIQGFSENLNYPPKFHAIKELIKEGIIYKQQPPVKFKEEKIIQTEGDSERSNYVVVKGDTLFGIARKFKTLPQELYSHNRKNPHIRNLKPGDKIEIPPIKRKGYSSYSLIAEAKKRGKSEKAMRFLNPHILDAQSPLPNGTILRS